MTADVEMVDSAEATKSAQKLCRLLVAEMTIVSASVAGMDLRALSRVKLGGLKRLLTLPLLKTCMQTLLPAGSTEVRDVVLEALQGPAFELDEESIKILTAATGAQGVKSRDSIEMAFLFAVLAADLLMSRDQDLPDKEAVSARLLTQLCMQLGSLNRRTLDSFAARLYRHFARVTGDSALIRNDLLAIYRTSCLRHDAVTQATVLNLVLRNFLQANLMSAASQFVAKTSFPENGANSELARYLFYLGRLRSVQMNYPEAHKSLTAALRKAPQSSKKALAFKVIAWKFCLTVELLMGEIPERKQFLQSDMLGYLKPYEDLAQAVRGGSVPEFEAVVTKNAGVFETDDTLSLVNRLRYNVIKTGLRKISFSYSRISLQDISTKLGLESVEGAAGICSKAIADGVIAGEIDYDAAALVSKGTKDIYGTDEPQAQLHKRIVFCLQLHNDCVKNMEYPSATDNDTENVDPEEISRANRERDELIKEAEEEDLEDMM